MSKVIKFYIQNQYGCPREFIHPENAEDAKILARLTGKKTVDPVIHELVCDLAGGTISFQKVSPVY